MTTPSSAIPGLPGPGKGKPTPRLRDAPRSLYDRAAASGQRILLAEFVACLAIDAIRFAADFAPTSKIVTASDVAPAGAAAGGSGTSPHGGKGPLSVLGGVLGVFFVLSLLPSKRIAAAAGAVVTLALLINSETQMAALAAGLKAGPPGKAGQTSPRRRPAAAMTPEQQCAARGGVWDAQNNFCAMTPAQGPILT